jgi:hypothetical protein
MSDEMKPNSFNNLMVDSSLLLSKYVAESTVRNFNHNIYPNEEVFGLIVGFLIFNVVQGLVDYRLI